MSDPLFESLRESGGLLLGDVANNQMAASALREFTVNPHRQREQHEEQQERFLMEARITGQLEHPGIVPVHDLGLDEEGRPFYIMTFIRGRTLKEVIDDYHAGGSASKSRNAPKDAATGKS